MPAARPSDARRGVRRFGGVLVRNAPRSRASAAGRVAALINLGAVVDRLGGSLARADTSVWIPHFRGTTRELASALEAGEVLGHPHVVGELACGNLKDREETLQLLRALRAATIATDEEVLTCIEENRLFGTGLGYTDVHLLASALLTPARLWTVDGALAREARRLKVFREDA